MVAQAVVAKPRPDVATSGTAFVFAGGGSLGATQVGMLRAVVAEGIRPDIVIGASVGAINGAYFAANPTLDGVLRLEALWLGINRRDVFPITLRRVFAAFLHRLSLVDPSGLRALLERHLGQRLLEETTIPMHVVATDLLSGQPVVLSSGSMIEAILASTAIPAIFPAVQMGERYLVDGAVASATPIITAVELGATRIIVFPAAFACHLDQFPTGAIANALHALTLLVSRQLARDMIAVRNMSKLGNDLNLIMVPPLCPVNVSSYDFSRVGELIDGAATSTRNWLQSGGMVNGTLEQWVEKRASCAFCQALGSALGAKPDTPFPPAPTPPAELVASALQHQVPPAALPPQ
jgi:NTE family protein